MMNHQDVNAGGAGLMLNSMVIKRESFENDMSSSAEYDESGSEIGSIKADISDDQLRKLPDEKIASNGREARNRAEKNRRDKLNGSIQELSTMVPHVAESPRRVDKTAVLRYSAHGLRIHYVFGKTIDTSSEMKPMVPEALMKLLDSFLLTITCRGQIVLVSSSVEHHLGHCQTDLFGQNILQITHPDDHGLLKKQIIPTDLETLFDIQPEDESGEPRPRTQEEEDAIDRKLSADKRTFTVRLARAGPRSEPTTYEIVKLDGSFRRADSAPRGVKASTYPSGLQLIRRARGRDDSIPLHTISGNDIVLVAMARVIRPPKVSERILEANQYEYKTRHLIDGRIIHCDQRISLVAGYMTEEVNGLSPFTFMHQDDVRWVIVALRQMYDHNSSYGESCYRLITRTGKFVYLKTRGYLEIDKDTNKVHSFVCINTLISEEEGRKRVRDMKNKFSIIINTKIPPSAIDVPAAENPHQLERAIIYLIQNLQNPDDNGDDESDSQNKGALGSDIDKRYSKSPSLAIIPPKPCTIKSSIKKSVNVVTTARNYMQRKRLSKSKSPSSDSDNEDNNSRSPIIRMSNSPGEKNLDGQAPDDSNDPNAASTECVIKQEIDYEDQRVPPLPSAVKYFEMKCFATTVTSPSSAKDLFTNTCKHNYNNKQPYRSTSVLKRTHNADLFEEETGSSAAKRSPLRSFAPPSIQELTNPRSDLSQVLPSSFDAIDRSLLNIENAATELKEKLPSSQHQLDEIIVEHQEQRQMLETIHSEFQAHINNTGPTRPNIRDSNSAFHSKNELKPR